MEKITKDSNPPVTLPNETGAPEIKKLIEIPGQVIGGTFLIHLEYVKEKKGKKGVGALEKKLKEWGCPIDYKKIKPTKWYPIGLYASHLLAMKAVFDWKDKDIFDLGYSVPRYSPIVKILTKYLPFLRSPKIISKIASLYWGKHFTVGKIEAYLNEKEKRLIFRVKDFKIHPVVCTFLAGYFLRMTKHVIKSGKITIEETKCMFKGNLYHEYVIRWE